MIHTRNFVNACSGLVSKSVRTFAAASQRAKDTPKDLDKYDVVIIGSNLGGILSRQFEQFTRNYYKVMVIYDRNANEMLPIRGIYEQGQASKNEYQLTAKLAIDNHTAHSDGVGVEKIIPNENAVVLRNSRRIEYDHLVIAMGLNEDYEAIKGFEEAWQDIQHPVFTHKDYTFWKSSDPKHQRWISNFTGGNAFFCLPPLPYRGEVTSLNVLPAAQVWRNYARNGKVSPLSKLTVVNANDTFCQHLNEADRFIKQAMTRNGIDIQLGTNLVEIDKKNYKATFENIHTKEKTVKDYSNLYVIPPTKPHESLVEAGLVSEESNNLLDVDRETLRHKKYKNIFGLGEVNNLPTTLGFWNGFYQLHVVKHNLQRSLNGQTLNAAFDGRTKVPLLLNENSITFVEHYYDQKADRFNLVDKEGGVISKLRYLNWTKKQKKDFEGLYLGKTYGPPYYGWPKTFSDSGKKASQEIIDTTPANPSPKIEYAPIKKNRDN